MSENDDEYPDEYLDENGNEYPKEEPEQERGELKPCPFCGDKPHIHLENGVKYGSCINSDCIADASWHEPLAGSETDWNTRPIEDALTARIAELEAERRWRPVSENPTKSDW